MENNHDEKVGRDYEKEDKAENIYQDTREESEKDREKYVWATDKTTKEYNEMMKKKLDEELLEEAKHLTYREKN